MAPSEGSRYIIKAKGKGEGAAPACIIGEIPYRTDPAVMPLGRPVANSAQEDVNPRENNWMKSRGSDGNASLPARRVPEASTSVDGPAISGKLSASDARKTAHVRRGCNAAPGTIAHAVRTAIGSQFVCLENTQGMFGQGIAHIGDAARPPPPAHPASRDKAANPKTEQRHEDRNDQKLWKRPLDHGKDATNARTFHRPMRAACWMNPRRIAATWESDYLCRTVCFPATHPETVPRPSSACRIDRQTSG